MTGTDPESVPDVTVIVPSRDRPGPLAACLDALAGQRDAPPFEVVVVDDASVDAAGVAAVVNRHRWARLVRAEGRGPAAARNLGATEARAPLLCFTDDDCRPGPGWVAAMAGAVGGRHRSAVAGPTRNARPADPWATASQIITNHLVDADRVQDRVRFAPTSNVACSADVFEEIPFDETFPLAAGEDRDWCTRLEQRGVPIVFSDHAWVDHHQDLDLRRFWRQQSRYGRGARRWQSERGRGERLQPARFYVDLVRKGVAHGPVVAGLVVVAQVATAVGLLSEAVSARRVRPRSAPTGETRPDR